MKKLTLLLVFLFFSLIPLVACQGSQSGDSTSFVGKYVNIDNDSEYLELYDDGTYYLWERGVEFTGTWQVENDTLIITFDHKPAHYAVEATIKGNTINDQEGKTWEKE